MTEWISVKDRLPENYRKVLCYCRGGAFDVLKYDSELFCWVSHYPNHIYLKEYVTYWMPLPEPPKEVE